MYRRFHWHLPTRHTVGVLIFATILFFGPWALLFRYNVPFPPRVLDMVGLWYAIGSSALLVVCIGPAHPKFRK
ncbi:MAG: hypothetical protein V1929_11170 [bacterium]